LAKVSFWFYLASCSASESFYSLLGIWSLGLPIRERVFLTIEAYDLQVFLF